MKYLFLAGAACYFIVLSLLTQHTAWTEMIVYPYLINHGFVMYKDIILPYTPLFLWFLNGTEGLIGYTPQISLLITAGLAVINTFVIFMVTEKIAKSQKAALLAVSFYALWFFYFEGNGLWFELFQTSFIILGIYFIHSYLFNTMKRQDLLYGLIFLTLSFLSKQSAIWILLVVGLWLLKKTKDLVTAGAVFLTGVGITFLIAFIGGYAVEYWQWAYVYAFFYFPFSPGHSQYPSITEVIKLGVPLIVIVPLLKTLDKKGWFVISVLCASFLSAMPRWGLFHLQPFLALLAVFSAPYWEKILLTKSHLRFVAMGVIVIWVIVVVRQDLRFWKKPVRFFEPQIYQQSALLKNYPELFIFNGPDQIYPLTEQIPMVKPYVQNFAWYMEAPGIQERVVTSLQNENPDFILYSPIATPTSYEIGYYRPGIVADYIEQNYYIKEKLSDTLWILQKKL